MKPWQPAQHLLDGEGDLLFDLFGTERGGHGVDLDLHGRGIGKRVDIQKTHGYAARDGEFDLAFFKQPAGASNGTVALREQLVWVSGPNYAPDDQDSVPLVLFPEGCAYRHCAVSALKDHKQSWHVSFVSPSFECLKSAAVEGMGITVLARTLVTPPLRVVHGLRLPQLPAVELVYSFGRRSNSRVVSELASYLADSLTNAGTTHAVPLRS